MHEPQHINREPRATAALDWAGVIAVALLLITQFALPHGAVRWLSACGACALLLAPVFIFPPFFTLARHGGVAMGKAYFDTTRLVDRGVFAIVRHPQYLGYILLTLGFALLSQHPVALALGAAAVTFFYLHTVREERDCLRRFGATYDAYRRRVPRFNFLLGAVRLLARRAGRASPEAAQGVELGDPQAALPHGVRRMSMTDQPGRNDRGYRAPGPRPIGEMDRQVLLRFARQTLEEYLSDGLRPPVPTGSGALLAHRATFVTLRTRATGALRGCVGETTARRPLVESAMNMTVAAATEDPRFPPVEPAEVPGLHIEISALTPMEPILPNEIEVGRHGLMIRWKGRSGLLLPQVPVSCKWSRDEFLTGVCRKAGLPDDAWSAPDAELLGFECEVWEEEHDEPDPYDPA
jgi:AmmeMemoRadiSam system protein A